MATDALDRAPSRHDSALVLFACAHALLLFAFPFAPVIAIGVWWNSNTIAHLFLHRPFFRSHRMNRLFSAALSLLLGIPQRLWRDRHLAHHAGITWKFRASRQLAIETALIFILWTILAAVLPRYFLLQYLPGYCAGLALCALQGYWEHPANAPVSHYGFLYNFLCFNDGYHAEHHSNPSMHWRLLPLHTSPSALSKWPPLLRWLDVRPLELLERLVCRSTTLQRFVLKTHKEAFARLLPRTPVRRVVIVGGGLFPRTALILRELLPGAQLIILDSDPQNLALAESLLGETAFYLHQRYTPGHTLACDLAVVPLCLDGDREIIYRYPPAPLVLVHDWLWRARGSGAIISALLLKRLNRISP